MDEPVAPGKARPCPHCLKSVLFIDAGDNKFRLFAGLTTKSEGPGKAQTQLQIFVQAAICPSPGCRLPVVDLVWLRPDTKHGTTVERFERIFPSTSSRASPHQDVPSSIREVYLEAALVESKSARAAAALARRCLQAALWEKGFTAKNLNEEILAAEKGAAISSVLRQKLEIVRHVGNYAAHPLADGVGGLLTVEPGEVDALFDALDELFDEFFVKPADHARRLALLNQKLAAAGKPQIK